MSNCLGKKFDKFLFMVHIGQKIKELVDAKKITAIELSKVLGKSRQTVYNMYNDMDVSTEVIQKLNQELGIPFQYFFGDLGVDLVAEDKEGRTHLIELKNPHQTDDNFWKEQIRLKDQLLIDEKERLKKCERELAKFKNGGESVYEPQLP